jgi:hypothetical protein
MQAAMQESSIFTSSTLPGTNACVLILLYLFGNMVSISSNSCCFTEGHEQHESDMESPKQYS